MPFERLDWKALEVLLKNRLDGCASEMGSGVDFDFQKCSNVMAKKGVAWLVFKKGGHWQDII